jgi:hypothetical protein
MHQLGVTMSAFNPTVLLGIRLSSFLDQVEAVDDSEPLEDLADQLSRWHLPLPIFVDV